MIWSQIPDVWILIAALVLDVAMGEPPNALHPVVWMGNLIALFMKAPVYATRSKLLQFLYGVGVALVIVALFGMGAYFLLAFLRGVNIIAYVAVGAVLLKMSFSVRALRAAAVRVKRLLTDGKLPEARSAVRSLVGRDTSELDEGQIVSATVESVAENTCDSFVAPLFYFVFLGVPGALAYRAINTLDNSIGFRGKYEYLGKFAARLDDVANFVPARITAFIFVLAAFACRKDAANAWRIMFRDHKKTASPNGGWTMGAMAGALDVSLEKLGHYRLGDSRDPLMPAKVDASLNIVILLIGIWTVLVMAGRIGCYAVT